MKGISMGEEPHASSPPQQMGSATDGRLLFYNTLAKPTYDDDEIDEKSLQIDSSDEEEKDGKSFDLGKRVEACKPQTEIYSPPRHHNMQTGFSAMGSTVGSSISQI